MLAEGYLPEYGGELCYIVVMQHMRKDIIGEFISDLSATL